MRAYDVSGLSKQMHRNGTCVYWPTLEEWKTIYQLEADRRELLRPASPPTDTLLRPSQEVPNTENLLTPKQEKPDLLSNNG